MCLRRGLCRFTLRFLLLPVNGVILAFRRLTDSTRFTWPRRHHRTIERIEPRQVARQADRRAGRPVAAPFRTTAADKCSDYISIPVYANGQIYDV